MSDWRPSQTNNQVSTANGFRVGQMTLADIVDNSFKLFKSNWKELFKAILLFSIPMMVFSVFELAFNDGRTLADAFDTGANSGAGIGTGWVAAEIIAQAIDYFFLASLLTAIVSRIFAASYLGQPITFGTSFKGLAKKWLGIAGASVLFGLALFGATVAGLIPVGLLSLISPAFSLLGLFIIVPFVAIALLLSLYLQVIAIEEATVTRAFSRSYALVRRRFWPYLGTAIVIYIVAIVFAIIVQVIVTVIASLLGAIADPISYPVLAFGSFLTQMIIVPIVVGAFTLIYFDARVRFEGFDIELAARSSEQSPS